MCWRRSSADDLTRALCGRRCGRLVCQGSARLPRLTQGSTRRCKRLCWRHAGPSRCMHCWRRSVPVSRTATATRDRDADARAAIEQAIRTGAAASWNAGCLAYAEAVLAGRAGNSARASALADEAAGHFAPFAPWWNGLARRLVAPSALRDGWGSPASWLREAASGFEGNLPRSAGVGLSWRPAPGRRACAAVRRAAAPQSRRSCAARRH